VLGLILIGAVGVPPVPPAAAGADAGAAQAASWLSLVFAGTTAVAWGSMRLVHRG
jgi:hypothetical protein